MNQTALYSNGDSVVWGAELKNKATDRFSSLISAELNLLDCNNSSAGVSNDYIYRQTLRDVLYWKHNKIVWSEDIGWKHADSLFVLIGWTAPTRFEWWHNNSYQQERLWADYDKWGINDIDKNSDLSFILNQTQDIPSYIRTFNHIISLSAVLSNYKIPYYFFNTFYDYQKINEPKIKIDAFGRDSEQASLEVLWDNLPKSMTDITMYSYIKKHNGDFLERNHPSKKSHKIWSDYLLKHITHNALHN